ncbi:MAG: hypothetical protein WDZ37_06415 [Solirubrobacterales bacterium]
MDQRYRFRVTRSEETLVEESLSSKATQTFALRRFRTRPYQEVDGCPASSGRLEPCL